MRLSTVLVTAFAAIAAASPYVGRRMETATSTTLSAEATPQPELQPDAHPDPSHPDHLKPQHSGDMHYSGGDNPIQAKITANFNHPAVILENSAHVASITCPHSGSTDTLLVTFVDNETFERTKGLWSDLSQFIIITHSAPCLGVADGQRAYFLVSSISSNGDIHTITATGKEIDIDAAVTEFTIDWKASASSFGAHTEGELKRRDDDSKASCSKPPSKTIKGLPAAACGPDFDKDLDDAYGYYNFDQAHFSASLKQFAPGLKDFNFATYDDGISLTRSLHKRGWFSSLVRAVSHAIKSVTNAVVKAVTKTLPKVITRAVAFLGRVVTSIINLTWSPSFHTTMHINAIVPNNVQQTVFGPAFQIINIPQSPADATFADQLNKLNAIKATLFPGTINPVPGVTIYCVGCGIQGTVQLSGSISVSLAHGVTSGKVGMAGSLDAGLELGLNGFATINKDVPIKRIAAAGLPGFTIPNIITVGPEVTLDLAMGFTISAQGQLLAGVQMQLHNFAATMDLVDPSKSTSSGFNPIVNKVFKAAGQMTATASLGLPLGLAVGIDLLKGKFAKQVALIDTPSIQATATIAGDFVLGSGGAISGPCNGFLWSINFANRVAVNVFGLKTITLNNYVSPPLAEGCITLTHPPPPPPPPPPACTPGQVVVNGGFDTLTAGVPTPWTVPTGGNNVITFGTVPATPSGPNSLNINFPNEGTVTLSQIIEFCPNTNYDLTFRSRRVTNSGVCTVNLLYGPIGAPTTSITGDVNLPFQATGDAFFDTDGPYTVTFAGGTPSNDGTSTNKVQLNLVITCTAASSNTVSLDDISILPVTAPVPAPRKRQATPATDTATYTFPSFSDPTDVPSTPDFPEDVSYISILDSTSALQLSASANGDLGLTPAGSSDPGAVWASVLNVVASDAQDRILHYYSKEMAQYGVSRLRVAPQLATPQTSKLVTLAPILQGSKAIYVAADTQGNAFFLVVCAIDKQPSQVFIVKDLDDGVEALKKSELMWTVVGGKVTACGALALVTAAGNAVTPE